MSNVVRLEYAYGVCPKCKGNNYLRYLIRKDGLIHKPYEIKCINCNSYFTKEDIFGSGEETTPKPITNADRIRSMTDEELAKAFADACPEDGTVNRCCQYFAKGSHGCYDCWLDWLKQEAEDGR
jgi:hypothetical protein